MHPLLGDVRDLLASTRGASFTSGASMVASGRHVDDPAYERWLPVVGQAHGRHRKVWEWCFLLQALEERGLLRSGVRALGFGVGTEPVVAALAGRGVRVVATDQPAEQAGAWGESGQHAAALDAVRRPDLCPNASFDELVTFRPLDMRMIPDDLTGFDANWSSCCFEHLGSPARGFDFVVEAMRTLRPGGVAVHTTEIDCDRSSASVLEIGSLDAGDYACFYRRTDLRRLVDRLRRAGHEVRCNYHVGTSHPLERAVDEQPYSHDPHLRLRVADRIVSSFGLVVTKGQRRAQNISTSQ